METTVRKPHGLLNRRAIRAFLLEYAGRTRAHKFSRVAESVFDQLESGIRQKCRALVDAQPSAGKTIK